MELEEQKGTLKDYSYSKEIIQKSKDIKKQRLKIKNHDCKNIEEEKAELENCIASYEQEKEKYLEKCLEDIKNGKYEISINIKEIKNKITYCINDIRSWLISKCLMLELRHCYDVRIGNRNDIVEELIALLDNQIPKVIIRLDIHHFFESIEKNDLINKILNDNYITYQSAKYLKKFFRRYNEENKSDNALGIPRGLSFSSVLAEIYMKDFDKTVKQIKGIYFYKRYVDDIIILANPYIKDEASYKNELDNAINKVKLSFNSDKMYLHNTLKVKDCSFEYLGYEFKCSDNKINILLSQKRLEKYKKQIYLIFDIYNKINCYSERKIPDDSKNGRSDTTLQFMHRLNALTSNGRLKGRKNFVIVGIYYSNKYVTEFSQFKQLDKYLRDCLEDSNVFKPSIRLFNYGLNNNHEDNIKKIKEKILTEYSFYRGFTERRMYRWKDYPIIMKQLQNLYYHKNEKV